MANTFDGDNLIITLEPVVSGVLDVDVYENLYEDGKDWYLGHPDNRQYPFPFVSDGGNPLTSIINQGGYIFLNNTAGWRIRPFENDGTYYFTGNLAVRDTTLPALIPTTGAFTVGIFGLQPVTQGVTPAMRSQLAFNTFQGEVAIDVVNGVSGTGEIELVPIGTRKQPSNNMADALTIADREGLRTFKLISDLTLSGTDLSGGYKFIGDSPFYTLTALASADITNCNMENLTLAGEMDGLNLVENCSLNAITSLSGFVFRAAFKSTLSLSGETHFFDCYSQVAGSGYPVVSTNGHEVGIRNYRGSVGLAAVTGGNVSAGVVGGRLLLDNTCTGGTVHVRAEPFEVIDNSAGTTVLDEAEGEKSRKVHDAHYLRRRYDSGANTITLYAADGVTPLYVFDTNADQSDINPQ